MVQFLSFDHPSSVLPILFLNDLGHSNCIIIHLIHLLKILLRETVSDTVACVLTQPVNPKGLTGLHTAPEMAVSHSVYLLIPEIHSLIKKVLEERVKVALKVPR